MNSIWYRMLLLACQAGQTTQLALNGALKSKRITSEEHAELSRILDEALNPPPAPEPVADSPEPVQPTPADDEAPA